MRRMDRYKEEDNHVSRLDKNKELYKNVSSNTIYTNITDVTNTNAYEINTSGNNQANTSYTTREAYQQMKKYQNVEPVPRTKKELDDFNYLYQQKNENKIYDINSVLEQAHQNRQEKDGKEEKRKLKNNSYNILSGVNKEELEKYREEKKKRMLTPQEEEIRDLIDTIASKTLAGELDKETTVDLLSDLMATNMLDKVEGMQEIEETEVKEEVTENTESEGLNQEQIKEIEMHKDDPVNNLEEKDNDFYTRSMDLSDKDFDFGETKEKSLPFILKLFIFLLIVAIIAVAGYFIYLRIK